MTNYNTRSTRKTNDRHKDGGQVVRRVCMERIDQDQGISILDKTFRVSKTVKTMTCASHVILLGNVTIKFARGMLQ